MGVQTGIVAGPFVTIAKSCRTARLEFPPSSEVALDSTVMAQKVGSVAGVSRTAYSTVPLSLCVPAAPWMMCPLRTRRVCRSRGACTPSGVGGRTSVALPATSEGDEALVLTLPDTGDRYHVVPLMDMWTDVFASLGTRTTGNAGGTFAIVGPDWKGTLPQGVRPIVSPTEVIVVSSFHIELDGGGGLHQIGA